jgi:hypothetical protein
MSGIDVPVSETVLLTGSGFTKNYCGLLASEMWEEINNYIENTDKERLKILIKKDTDFDYEKIFEEVMKGEKYSKEEKHTINECLLESYKSMDQRIVTNGYLYGSKVCIDSNALESFIRDLASGQKEKGFFFTLNQDISIERYFRTAIITPCIERINELDGSLKQGSFKNSWFRKVPDEEGLVERRLDKEGRWKNEKVYYIKLHGSFNWKDSGDNELMVIGTSKLEDIDKEPILKWYLDIFKDVLSMPNRRLLIIGYGFRDKHINDVIVNSINQYGLKLHINYHKDRKTFENDTLAFVSSDSDKEAISGAISCYYGEDLMTIFRHNNLSAKYYKLQKYFLGK